MYRHLYQMRVADDIVQKLELQPGGIMPMIHRIEKEYEVNILFHKNKQMILISQSKEVLELVHETLESRYVNCESNTNKATKDEEEVKETEGENKVPDENESVTDASELDTEVHTIHNRHYSPVKSRDHSRQRSVLRSPSRSPTRAKNKSKNSKKVVFA